MKLIGLTIFAAAANAGKYNKFGWVQGLDFDYENTRTIFEKKSVQIAFQRNSNYQDLMVLYSINLMPDTKHFLKWNWKLILKILVSKSESTSVAKLELENHQSKKCS